jgi:hypothetical protein
MQRIKGDSMKQVPNEHLPEISGGGETPDGINPVPSWRSPDPYPRFPITPPCTLPVEGEEPDR